MDLRGSQHGMEFLVGVGAAVGVFSAVHSSLWSAQNFGDTPETADSCRNYSYLAAAATLGLTGLGAAIDGSPYYLYGGIVVTALMLYGYRRSLSKAAGEDNTPAPSFAGGWA